MSSAVFSDCKRYRYRLERELLFGDGACCFIMLNPSTADASQDDPTIRRCVGFARRWGYRSLIIVNLFAFRSTDPFLLFHEPEPIGKDNDSYIYEAAMTSESVVAGWGVHGTLMGRDKHVMSLLNKKKVFCLGTTKDGCPRHPLYVSGQTPLKEFRLAA